MDSSDSKGVVLMKARILLALVALCSLALVIGAGMRWD
jgi:hypothetical protein